MNAPSRDVELESGNMVSSARRPLALLVLCAASFAIVFDASMVTVALPSIGRDLDLAAADLQWVLSSYSLVFGGLLLLGGRAADVLGRRRVFPAGFALLGLFSVIAALAIAPWMLMAARVGQGAAAAVLAPTSLSLVTSVFEGGRERDRAVERIRGWLPSEQARAWSSEGSSRRFSAGDGCCSHRYQ
jgi:MFS family permease